MCELLHTPALVQKMHGGQTPYGIGDYLGPGQSVLGFITNRSSFLIGKLLLGELSETVVVVGNAPPGSRARTRRWSAKRKGNGADKAG
jgi:hypothetical protein